MRRELGRSTIRHRLAALAAALRMLLPAPTRALIHNYLAAAGHGDDEHGALFRPMKNNSSGKLDEEIAPDGIYKLVRAYSAALGFENVLGSKPIKQVANQGVS